MTATETDYDFHADLAALRAEIAEVKQVFAEYRAAQTNEVRTEHLTIVRPDGAPLLETSHSDSHSLISICWPGESDTGFHVSVSHGESDGEWGPLTTADLSLIAHGDIAGGLSVFSERRERDGSIDRRAETHLELENFTGSSDRMGDSDRLVIAPTSIVRELPGRRDAAAVDFRMVQS